MSSSAPPTYEEAVRRDPWPIIVCYLHRRDVAALVRVNRHLSTICNEYLWSDATRHFDLTVEESPYTTIDSLYLFYSRLYNATRPETAALVRTLHVSPTAERYHGLSRFMLGKILRRIPSLQALFVSGVGSFDHGLTTAATCPIASTLRVLVARKCDNVTPESLCSLLPNLSNLQYLDLSYSRPASKHKVVGCIVSSCEHLRVLKLRGTGLDMNALNGLVVEASVRPHLRSLDVRDNGIQIQGFNGDIDTPLHSFDDRDDSFDEIDHDSVLLNTLIHRRTPAATVEMDYLPSSPGLTHLYLSGNTLMPVPSCVKFFGRPSIRYLDISQPGHLPVPQVMGRLVAKHGHDLLFLRTDIGNFPRNLDDDTSQSTAQFSIVPPSYDQAVSASFTETVNPIKRLVALRVLVLTGITAHSSQAVVETLKNVIKYLASRQRKEDLTEYYAKPTTARPHVRKIVLEIAPNPTPDSGLKGSSSTEDAISEAFWTAAADDFSFFEDEKPTNRLSEQHDRGKKAARSASSGADSPFASTPADRDVVAELSRWRVERRLAYHSCKSHSTPVNTMAREHWPGQVQIVQVQSGVAAARDAMRDPWDHLAGLEDL